MSDLPRKFVDRKALSPDITDLSVLMEVYYFVKGELMGAGLNEAEHAMCKQKLVEIRRTIEKNIFGVALHEETKTIEGDAPEDIDLSKYEDE